MALSVDFGLKKIRPPFVGKIGRLQIVAVTEIRPVTYKKKST